MKLIVAGTRTVRSLREVERAIAEGMKSWGQTAGAIEEIVTGGCRGVDALAEQWAARRGMRVRAFPARWADYGPSAGPKRNAAMARYAHALVAVWDGESRGTADMIRAAKAQGLPVYVHRVDGEVGP